MSSRVITQLRTWLPGTAVALVGALLVREVAPHCPGVWRQLVAVTGLLVAPYGLYLVARDVGRKAAARVATDPGASEDT